MTDFSKECVCFLPCRKGSQRIPRKNVKPFAGYKFGLLEIKLQQLLESKLVRRIVLTTDDSEILEFASSLKEHKIQLHERSANLSSSETSTDKLVGHALELIPEGHILWTHVTSPFITAANYDSIIEVYHEKLLSGYDSLMSVTPLRSFLWQQGRPLNYDREVEKWPRTQTLLPVHEVNSGVFLAPSDVYRKHSDRIGSAPFLFEMDSITSHDIDWSADFEIAECLVERGLAKF